LTSGAPGDDTKRQEQKLSGGEVHFLRGEDQGGGKLTPLLTTQ